MSGRLLFGYAAFTLVTVVLAVVIFVALRLITQETPSPHPKRTSQATYVVKRGDVLSEISERTGVTMERLQNLNHDLDPLDLVPGQRIKLRAVHLSAAERAARRRRARKRPRYYVVKPGDGLSTVAARSGVPLFRLLELNKGIERRTILPGQRIKLRRAPR